MTNPIDWGKMPALDLSDVSAFNPSISANAIRPGNDADWDLFTMPTMPSPVADWDSRVAPKTELDLNSVLSAYTDAEKSTIPAKEFEDNSKLYLSQPDDTVTFIIGEERKKFILHRQVVCKYSEGFGAAFHSQFVEGQTGKYELVDTSAEAFRMLVEYFYSEKITFRCHNLERFRDINKSHELDHQSVCDEEVLEMINLYILANKYLVWGVLDLVIEQLAHVAIVCRSFRPACLDIINGNTEPGCELRRLAVEQVVWREEGAVDFAADYTSFPQEMVVDMFLELKAYASKIREIDFRNRWTRSKTKITTSVDDQLHPQWG